MSKVLNKNNKNSKPGLQTCMEIKCLTQKKEVSNEKHHVKRCDIFSVELYL